MGAGVDVNIDGPNEEFLRELEGAAIGQILCHVKGLGL